MRRRLCALLVAGALMIPTGPAFADPVTLDNALAKGREVSPRIARAQAELKAAEARTLQAGLRPNPELGKPLRPNSRNQGDSSG